MRKPHPKRPHLAAWREQYGHSAECLSVTHTTVSRWENGVAGVDNETFAAIAEVYGITVAELSGPPHEAALGRQINRLMQMLPKLDEAQARAIADMTEQLLRQKKTNDKRASRLRPLNG